MRLVTLAMWSVTTSLLIACGSRSPLGGGLLLKDEASTGGTPGTGGTIDLHPGTGGWGSGTGGMSGGAQNTGGAATGGASTGGVGTGGVIAEPFAIGFGDPMTQYATAVEATASGAWVAGNFYGELSGDASPAPDNLDVFLRRIDLEGNVEVALELGGPQNQQVFDMALAPNGDVLVGGAFQKGIHLGVAKHTSAGSYDGFVARFDSEGVWKSSYAFGNDSNQFVNDVEVMEDGSILALSSYGTSGGSFLVGSTTVTSAGSGDFMLIRLDAEGVPVAARSYGGVGDERAKSMAIGPEGTRWILGMYKQAVDFGCGPLPASTAGTNVFVLGLDAQGDCVSNATIESPGDDWPADIAVDSAGFLFVSGIHDGPVTLTHPAGQNEVISGMKGSFVIKLTSLLGPSAAYTFQRKTWVGAGLGSQRAPSLDVDAEDNVLVGGAFEGELWVKGSPVTSAGLVDAFVMKIAPDGETLWAETFGDAESQIVYAVSAGPTLDFAAGAYEGTLLGAPTELVNVNFDDVFVIGLAH